MIICALSHDVTAISYSAVHAASHKTPNDTFSHYKHSRKTRLLRDYFLSELSQQTLISPRSFTSLEGFQFQKSIEVSDY